MSDKLALPDVTLVMIETREHTLARMAIEDCVALVDFAEVLVLTDRPSEFYSLTRQCEPRFHTVPDWPDKEGWARASWYEVPPLLRTPFALQIQWDSWVWDVSKWDGDYLNYDMIGSPWWYKDGKNVGNTGFSLISTPLKRYLRDRAWKFPCTTSAEDDLMCRKYRPELESLGFRWAPENVAREFAFECVRPSPESRHFGFHGCFNFNEVLSEDRLLDRAEIMARSPYITKTDYMWKTFLEKNATLFGERSAQRGTAGAV